MATTEVTTTDPSFGQLYEEALDKFTALAAIVHLLSKDEDADEVMRDAANHAWQIAHDGTELMAELWERHGEEYERKPAPTTDGRPEWTGASADAETKALGARILALPRIDVGHVMEFALHVTTAHGANGEPNRITLDEIGSMLKRGASLRSINAFWLLKLDGLAAHVPEAPPTEEPENDDEPGERVATTRTEGDHSSTAAEGGAA